MYSRRFSSERQKSKRDYPLSLIDSTATAETIEKYSKPFQSVADMNPNFTDNLTGAPVIIEKTDGKTYAVTDINGITTQKTLDIIKKRYSVYQDPSKAKASKITPDTTDVVEQQTEAAVNALPEQTAPTTQENQIAEQPGEINALEATEATANISNPDASGKPINTAAEPTAAHTAANGANQGIRVETVERYQANAADAKTGLTEATQAARNLTRLAETEIQNKFGDTAPETTGTILPVVSDLLLAPDTLISGNTINTFANIWVDMWNQKNATSISGVKTALQGRGMPSSNQDIVNYLTEYAIRQTVTANGADISAALLQNSMFRIMASEFKNWTASFVQKIAVMKGRIWNHPGQAFQQQAGMIANGDWAGAMEIARSVEQNVTGQRESADIIETPATISADMKTTLEKIEKILEIKIRFIAATGEDGMNGYYKDGVVYIAEDASDPIMTVVKHELTHRLKAASPDAYDAYEQYVMNTMSANNVDVQGAIDRLRNFYQSRGVTLDDPGIREELSANFTKNLLNGKNDFQRLINANPTVAQKLLYWLKDLIKKIKTALSGKGSNNRSVYQTGLTLSQLQEAERLWTEAFRAGEQQAESKTYEEIGKQAVKFSVSPDFYDKFDAWDKKTGGGYFTFGNPSDTLIKAGIPNKPIIMSKLDMINKAKKHNFSVDLFRKLPAMIDQPMLILQSRTHSDNGYVFYGELYDNVGRPIMAALHINMSDNELKVYDINRIKSAYARQQDGGENADQNLIRNSKILYPQAYNKRTVDWAGGLRLQLPPPLLNNDSNTKIPQKDTGVNTYSMQISEKDTQPKMGDTDEKHSFKNEEEQAI